MKMPTIRRLWAIYKRGVLQEGLGITKRTHATVLVQNAFYLGARSILQAQARLLEHGDLEELHGFIARQGRQLAAMRGERPRARRH
jgi:hypothetical protein